MLIELGTDKIANLFFIFSDQDSEEEGSQSERKERKEQSRGKARNFDNKREKELELFMRRSSKNSKKKDNSTSNFVFWGILVLMVFLIFSGYLTM